MFLFGNNYSTPGPGVDPDTPRKKGAARFFELLGRDFSSFYLAGILALLSALPWALGLWFAVSTRAVIPLLLAGVLGGILAAPQITGLCDTVLRALRDEPGYWWATYRRAWKRNAKASLVPEALFGLLLASQIFMAFCFELDTSRIFVIIMAVGVLVLLGMALFLFAQTALLDLPFMVMLRNALLLLGGFLPRAVLGVAWQLLYAAIIYLFWPLSGIVLLLCTLWLPAVLALSAIYPALDKTFNIEKRIKDKRDAELGESDI